MSEVTFDWKPGIEEVCLKLKGKERIGIQVPEGLKTKSHEIVTLVTKLTGAKVVLWGEATYGACYLADRPLEEIGADALIHMCHLPNLILFYNKKIKKKKKIIKGPWN